jgi:hypothetical protein
MKKPPRTLGISLSILAATCLFSCLPLTQSAVLLSLASRQQTEFLPPPAQPGAITPSAIGSEIFGLDTTRLVVQAGIAIGFLLLAIFAWRGKPPIILPVFIGAVLLLSIGNFVLLFNQLTTPPDLTTGIDSGAGIETSVNISQLCLSLAIPIYVVWYMSRGPARAFYRGYYRETPDGTPANTKRE